MSHEHHVPSALDVAEAPMGDRIVMPFRRFAKMAAGSGIVLLVMAALAMVWANSPWYHSYHDFFHKPISIAVGDWHMEHAFVEWIDDALMALFFLLVGLEIKREVLFGELKSPRKAALPVIAAVGGMAVPAIIYTGIALAARGAGSTEVHFNGWGVPTATDIAFALGVLALLGKRVPASLRVYLCTLAVADDLGALLVIAFFYTEQLNLHALYFAGCYYALIFMVSRMRVREPLVYLALGVPLWYFIAESGVHSTIAGVLLALQIPVTSRVDAKSFLRTTREALDVFEHEAKSNPAVSYGGKQTITPVQAAAARALALNAKHVRTPLGRLELKLGPWVNYGILPLFALGSAGVHLAGDIQAVLFSPVSFGVALGLFVGKPVGIFLASWLAVKLGVAVLPSQARWSHMLGVGMLAGIGFTMAIFVTNLAFEPGSPASDGSKIAILFASLLSAVCGLTFLWFVSKKHPVVEEVDAHHHRHAEHDSVDALPEPASRRSGTAPAPLERPIPVV